MWRLFVVPLLQLHLASSSMQFCAISYWRVSISYFWNYFPQKLYMNLILDIRWLPVIVLFISRQKRGQNLHTEVAVVQVRSDVYLHNPRGSNNKHLSWICVKRQSWGEVCTLCACAKFHKCPRFCAELLHELRLANLRLSEQSNNAQNQTLWHNMDTNWCFPICKHDTLKS